MHLADLSSSEGKLSVVELQQLLEVDEYALSSLWPEESGNVSSRANGCAEHEVELERVGEIVTRERSLDGILLEEGTQF